MFVAVVEEGEVLPNQKASVLRAGSSLAKVVTASIFSLRFGPAHRRLNWPDDLRKRPLKST